MVLAVQVYLSADADVLCPGHWVSLYLVPLYLVPPRERPPFRGGKVDLM